MTEDKEGHMEIRKRVREGLRRGQGRARRGSNDRWDEREGGRGHR